MTLLSSSEHGGGVLASAESAHPVLELCGVQRRYGGVSAVEGLNLQVQAGEFFALLGASGCGKTTTLRLIAGFEHPDAGTIRLQGQDVTAWPAHRRPVNTVFQNYALFPHLSVWDNVAFGPRSRGLAGTELRRRVGEALEAVRLAPLARRRPHQLSGGQQQRVALARALVNRPAALLLDEPLAALDPNLRRAMQDELKRIQRELGVTFLFVTHDREEALALSDRLAVMHGGRIAQVGSPRQLYDQPVSPYVATFLGGANLLPDGPGGWRLLRPERVRLSDQPPAGVEQGVRARLESITFQGATLELRLKPVEPLAGGFQSPAQDGAPLNTHRGVMELMALAARDNLPADLNPGCQFWCVWDPADTHPLGGGANGSVPGGEPAPRPAEPLPTPA